MKRTRFIFSVPRSKEELHSYLSGRTTAIAQAVIAFYQPLALIDAKAPKADVDEALEEAVLTLRAHIDWLEAKGRRYAEADNLGVDTQSSAAKLKTKVTTASPKKLVPDDDDEDEYDVSKGVKWG
jgi:hypothetical protein